MPQLDGLRGLAVLMVMVHHFTMTAAHDTQLGRWLWRATYAGWSGVDLFFVLSGFLITGILLEAKGSPHYFRSFYMRRVLRIFPVYYGVLAATLVVAPLLRPFPATVDDIVHRQAGLWLYGTNLVIAWTGQWCYDAEWLKLGHFWSLAVEEHFYLVWPAVVLLLSRRSLMWVCAGCIVTALALRWGIRSMAPEHGAFDSRLAAYVLTPCRMDALAVGGLAAAAVRGPGGLAGVLPWARLAMAGCGLVLGWIAWRNRGLSESRWAVQVFGYTLLALFFAGLLLQGMAPGRANLLRGALTWPPLRWFGAYSYALYVFHVPLQPFLDRVLGVDRLAAATGSYRLGLALYVPMAIAASTLLAVTSWHLYEKRFLRLKRFFEYRAPRQAAATKTAIGLGAPVAPAQGT